MDISPFVQFTLNSRYATRWILGGLLMYIPVLNFFSLGYLSKTSRLLIIGGLGLPTWDEKNKIWFEGVRALFVIILYEAIPCFLFSSGFFLVTLSNVTAFFGNIVMVASYVAALVLTFFIPFALSIFAEYSDFRKALEYERIFKAIREVIVPYVIGYVSTLAALFVCWVIIRIPYFVGFILSSVLSYYILLVSTYFFAELYKKTALFSMRFPKDLDGADNGA